MSKSERNGVIVLIVIISLVFILRFVVDDWFMDKNDYSQVIEQGIENQYKSESGESNDKGDNIIDRQYQESKESKVLAKDGPSSKLIYFKFDPNTVTYKELLLLGFSGKLANTLINYREKGGRFKKTADLLKLYHIDSSFYLKIEPFVKIAEKIDNKGMKEEIIAKQLIEINSADSALFVQLKGVGPVLASRICKYRKSLGGFARIDQICEVYNFPIETFHQIKDQLTLDTMKIEKMNINFAEINELKKHPYCKYPLARKIIDYRAKAGNLRSVDQLLNDSVLTMTEFEKLQSYLAVK